MIEKSEDARLEGFRGRLCRFNHSHFIACILCRVVTGVIRILHITRVVHLKYWFDLYVNVKFVVTETLRKIVQYLGDHPVLSPTTRNDPAAQLRYNRH